jgi:hypothetical protein
VEVVVDRLAGDEVVVVQSDALCIEIWIAIVTIVGGYCACRVEQDVVESAVFVVPSEQGEEHIVNVWAAHADLVIEQLLILEKEVFGW